MKTGTEFGIELGEQLRKQELRYWQRMHPNAKVNFNKKKNQIEIIYPLPKDYDLIQKFVKAL
jgi:hypothetical protein